MKRTIAIFFASLYLLGSTEAYQFMKFPLLIQHYRIHRQSDKDISFLKFIDIHYLQNQPFDSDYQQDMQLPFKTSNRTISYLNFDSVLIPKQPSVIAVFYCLNKSFRHFDDSKHASLNHGNIFQPPRA